MSFLATERKIGLFYFRLCKKKREGEGGKILHSVVPAEICSGKLRCRYLFFPCCCGHFWVLLVRHHCGFKVPCKITAIKISSLCLNGPLGFFGWVASGLGDMALKAASKLLVWILSPRARVRRGAEDHPGFDSCMPIWRIFWGRIEADIDGYSSTTSLLRRIWKLDLGNVTTINQQWGGRCNSGKLIYFGCWAAGSPAFSH